MQDNEPSQTLSKDDLQLEIKALREQVTFLEQENEDLKVLLENVTSHADFVESQLHETNEQLREEVSRRMKTMRALQFLIGMVTRDIADLQILLETTTEHGDLVEEILHNESIRDPLTGLFNRRYLDQTFDAALKQARQQDISLGIILGDIDFFRGFNNQFGHKAGDLVLKEVCQFLQSHVRESDAVYRYGGEEILLLLPGAGIQETLAIAESLRTGVKTLDLSYGDRPLGTVTISFGVACFPEQGDTSDDLIQAADEALYEAKSNGRDRVVVAPLLKP